MIACIKQLTGHPTRTMAMKLLAASSIAGPLHSAAAQDIYATSFQPPAFVAGAPLAGQDGWVSPVPVLSPQAAIIAASKKGGQSVRVNGASLESQPVDINAVTGGYYDAIGAYRRALDHDSGGTQVVRLSVDVRLDGRATPKSNFFSASLIAVAYNDLGGSEGVGELAISSDGHVYGSSGQDLVPVFLTRTKVALVPGTIWRSKWISRGGLTRSLWTGNSWYLRLRAVRAFRCPAAGNVDHLRRPGHGQG